jgi:hypothetical protein
MGLFWGITASRMVAQAASISNNISAHLLAIFLELEVDAFIPWTPYSVMSSQTNK